MRNRGEIEQHVAALLSKHHIEHAPVPIKELVIAEGLQVLESPIAGDVSGALVRSGGSAGIAVNATHHKHRQRFTIGHELGHYVLNHKGENDHLDWGFTVLRRDEKSSEAIDTHEIEANFFAASILMPKDFIRKDVTQLARFNGEVVLETKDIQSLARKYEVSETAMTYRLVSLGLIAPE